MSTTLGATPEATTTRRQPVALCVLVGAVVTVGWVLYRHYAFQHVTNRVFAWHMLGRWLSLALLVEYVLLLLPFGLALLLWGRDLTRSLRGGAAVLVLTVCIAILEYVFQRYVFGLHGEGFSATSARVFEWTDLLLVALLVPLAWGLARRSGRAWLPGILVGPLVASAVRELQEHWTWWEYHVMFPAYSWAWTLQAVAYVAPFVLAVLACWAIEARTTSRAEATGG